MKYEALNILNEWMDDKFTSLYRDLCDLQPGLLHWMGNMHRPKWWQRVARKEYQRVQMVFASHGILLTDDNADHFRSICRNNPQRFDEDCGGAVVRQLRATFGYAFLGPYTKLLEPDPTRTIETE